jgi:hypothetical protein
MMWPHERPEAHFTSHRLLLDDLKLLTMASHLNPSNRQSHVCNLSQLICDIRYAGLTQLLGVKVEIYQLCTLPTSSLQTSSPTSGGPLAPNGSLSHPKDRDSCPSSNFNGKSKPIR